MDTYRDRNWPGRHVYILVMTFRIIYMCRHNHARAAHLPPFKSSMSTRKPIFSTHPSTQFNTSCHEHIALYIFTLLPPCPPQWGLRTQPAPPQPPAPLTGTPGGNTCVICYVLLPKPAERYQAVGETQITPPELHRYSVSGPQGFYGCFPLGFTTASINLYRVYDSVQVEDC